MGEWVNTVTEKYFGFIVRELQWTSEILFSLNLEFSKFFLINNRIGFEHSVFKYYTKVIFYVTYSPLPFPTL